MLPPRLLDVDFEAELQAYQRRRSLDRSKGRHVSEIIHYIVTVLEPERFKGTEAEALLFEGGFIWEDVNSLVLGDHLGPHRQIELSVDGIYLTIDGFNTKRWRVLEFKDTKISARRSLREAIFLHWHWQIMAYARAMRTLEAELYVRHVNGAYELGGGRFGKTVGRGWLLEYTRQEIEENWEMLVRVNREMPEAA